MTAIGKAYNEKTKKDVEITSGTRSAEQQADAMYGKLSGKDDLHDYKNQDAAKDIKGAYDKGVEGNKSPADIKADMTKVINGQLEKGITISDHMKQNAVDVKSSNMDAEQKRAFTAAARAEGATVILETIPPHFHLQFDQPKP
jgi:hypothetical protein